MRRRLPSNKHRTKPFSRFLALGHPQLEPLFFQLGVLGRYQSDPRYIFRFDGLDGYISVKTPDYKGREMAEADKVGLETFGIGHQPERPSRHRHLPKILGLDVVATPAALGQL